MLRQLRSGPLLAVLYTRNTCIVQGAGRYGLVEDNPPAMLAKARQAVVLARSSDYYHYHLRDHIDFKLVICGLHDSYLHLPVWETSTNKRYKARETALSMTCSASSDLP